MFWKRWKQKPVTEEQEREFARRFEENQVGIKDKLAMVLSAMLVIVLPCALILTAIALLALWLFGAL